MNIYIGNLSLGVTKEELHQEFALFGEVTSVIIMENSYHRKYGFVVMPHDSQCRVAIIRLNGKTLRNQELKVIEALALSRHEGYYPKKRTGPLSWGVRNGSIETTEARAIQISGTSSGNN